MIEIRILPCGHSTWFHMPKASCAKAQRRADLVLATSIERSAVGDGRFLRAPSESPRT